MHTRDELARAVRENDAQAERGVDMDALLASLDVDPRAVAYVAEQRALRLALFREGWKPADFAQARNVALSQATLDLIQSLAAAWIDGFAAHARASR